MRLIDADALKNTLEKLWNVHDDDDFANKDVWREIENAPTIEPERKKGRWIIHENYDECSKCHCFTAIGLNYCPHCGSEMTR